MNAQTQLVRHLRWLAALCVLAACAAAADVMPDGVADGDDHAGDGVRIKDIASVVGVRSNQLVGYGLVVGLDGTGDNTSNTRFTAQSVANMLRQLGVALPPTCPDPAQERGRGPGDRHPAALRQTGPDH